MSEMSEKQFDLFQTGIQWVKDEQERSTRHSNLRHQQSTWGIGRLMKAIKRTKQGTQVYPVCTTACCLAGNIVLANGDTMVVPAAAVPQELIDNEVAVNVDYCMDAEGNFHSIHERAKVLAGLTEAEATYLFDGCRSAHAQIEYAQDVAARNGYTLDLV